MASKTERFELRLDADLIAKIDEWRSKQDDFPSRSEAVRRLVEKGLVNEAALSPGDRLITAMLCDIYKHLDVAGDIDAGFVRKAISDGHFWALEREYHSLIQATPVDNAIATEAIAILNMWHILKTTYEGMPNSEKKYVSKNVQFFKDPVVFPGFDGNGESSHFSVAYFFIREMGYFRDLDDKTDLNSHYPSLKQHRKMLSAFTSIQKDLFGKPMTKEQLVQIFEARHEDLERQ